MNNEKTIYPNMARRFTVWIQIHAKPVENDSKESGTKARAKAAYARKNALK